ncbi:YpdA family putative bacillithiol disulfide reductase [Daejeonella sp. H1SJ63]|uniref:YpdA family putative bacillithiol disulfide reductase n=1 Tax=Daejeonella sp. H1SJ63 TaxID=3034145 RepID=UPI0023EDBE4C|nr:YpdA family putative bacillithiol disulfide reductase [Daejeonella sp. H1SJ63]
MAEQYDILIIGGGPIGLACGIEAQKAGLSYIILEKGCLVNSLYNYPSNMTFFSTSEKLEIGNVPFMSISVKPNRNEALEYYRRVSDQFKLNIRLFEKVEDVRDDEGNYIIKTSKSTYRAANIIVATGFYDMPNQMNIPGEDLPKVKHYYKDPHYYARQKVIVVGANNSAVDAALETYRKGAEVTMVIRESQIGERVKYWVRPDIVNRIQEGSIKAYFNSSLTSIRENEVDIQGTEGRITLSNDFVLAMTGYKPDFSFLKKLGIRISEDQKQVPEHNPETMESNIKGIYLAGVVCGGMNTHLWFIENSRVHAEKIINQLTIES